MTPAARVSFATPILLVVVRVYIAVVTVLHVEEVVMTPAARVSRAPPILLRVFKHAVLPVMHVETDMKPAARI